MEQFALSFFPEVPERRIYSLRELSDGIREALERRFTNIWISGEISTVKLVQSGHCYFVLKDAEAQIKCVCWKLTYWRLKFKPKDGVQVIIRGRVDIYEGRSEYQFVVEAIEPQGQGALQIAFEEFKQRLKAEGLFEQARKKPMPRFPRRVGIVSSPKGAAIRDFVEILSRRFPGMHIRLFPARVQGPGSVEDVCRALKYFGTSGWAQVVVLARGGGSIEDLWTFNEEPVARAIAASPIPVVSAIGHETDFTIADFVADLRAPTPSAGAEMLIVSRQELEDRLSNLRHKIGQNMRFRTAQLTRRLQDLAIGRAVSMVERAVARRVQRVDDLDDRLRQAMLMRLDRPGKKQRMLEEKLRFYDLRPRLGRDRERMRTASYRAATAMTTALHRARQRLVESTSKLSQLDPRLVLERGYAIVLDSEGKVVRESSAVPSGTLLELLFATSSTKARVE